ncbi:MAG: TetR/AcrR family transcriptional regulator [Phaeodactylibacter sp.]|nr:TetR/AcrR family transcriptional regulator [Phaeodactylibacter sp.]MCB9053551.1 TetR/AcrR family transcriptional regulator [Lewinellaceae bacterium]
MAELNTKQKILHASVQLFNEYGLANVRLQQIATETGISVGNLAYHFRNKEAILCAIHEELREEVAEILSTYRIFPNLLDFDNQVSKYFYFIEKYAFYYVDSVEVDRTCPEMASFRRQHISKMISQIRKRFDFNISRGVIRKEARPGLYDTLAQSIWMLIAFWVPQSLVRGERLPLKQEALKETIWNLVYPHLTQEGIAEFEQLIVPLFDEAAP